MAERRSLFLSHSSADDAVVRALQQALAELGQPVWIDSRQLHGGDPLDGTIRRAIERAAGFAVLVSPAAHASAWVGTELKHALTVQRQRGAEQFPVIPLSLDGTPLGALQALFDDEPVFIPVRGGAGGVDAALDAILVALRLRLPTDRGATPQPPAESIEELVLTLADLRIVQHADGKRRAAARARLVYEPAAAGAKAVHSACTWRLESPLGPIEADDLRWYLEDYATWPSLLIAERARKLEGDLQAWGRLLHDAALPPVPVANVLQAWAAVTGDAGRRFSIEVDAATDLGAPPEEIAAVQEAATLLLGLPWELLHDGRRYLFQGAQPVRVRRRLPGLEAAPVPVLATPIRILLASPRPEDEACGYIDHRASALPLVQAMEALAGQVSLHLLAPATLPALRDELDRARRAGQPYHVLHFDGHGVFDRHAGLGALCFEHPEDVELLQRRRHQSVPSPELGALLHRHGIPLVVLEACQTAQAGPASESVASEMLKSGVGSVVAMSHSVLVETSRRFVQAFYGALARGARVGGAMLAGQRELKDNAVRGRVFGVGDFELQDWFVPVLFQDRDDPQLFRETPAAQTLEDWQARLTTRLGKLPAAPEAGFVGRSRELLALERRLHGERWAVLRGQGGEGKTALAAEFARWRVRSGQVRHAAFVSVETHGHALAVLDALGQQLLGAGYSVAGYAGLDEALQPVLRALKEASKLLVVDNLESVLAPPFAADDASPTLNEDARQQADAILSLCAQLVAAGDTRLVFTSREALPAPFDRAASCIELPRLARDDAVGLVERTLGLDARGAGAAADAAREDIEALVDAVHGHARTLALLAPSLRAKGPAATQAELVALMAEMEQRFPGRREQSLLASVALSLQRLSPAVRERVRVLGVFHGVVDLDMLRWMTGWQPADVAGLANELVATGLATPERYNQLVLNPALCPSLAGVLADDEREALAARWTATMGEYAKFLRQERSRDAEMVAALTLRQLPNLMVLLEQRQQAGDAAATIDLTTTLHQLLQSLGRPQLLTRVAQVRDAAVAALGDGWNHARFEAERTRIEQVLASGKLTEALASAGRLLDRARAVGEAGYAGADYDLAMACWLVARVMRSAGQPESALPLLDEARELFEAVEARRPGCGAEQMASVCLTDQGDCMSDLGRLEDAATAYEDSIRRDERRQSVRDVAVGKVQLGTVRLLQRRYLEALAAYAEARERFTQLDEPGSVAVAWHQTGMAYQDADQPEAAEDAYQRSLAIKVQLGNVAEQACTLGQLGNLYKDLLGRPEQAATYYRQAADRHVALGDRAGEGRSRNNLADTLRGLGRLDEARREIRLAIACKQALGHASEPWTSWATLADIEAAAGHTAAAAEARRNARAAYLAYRRDGGENHFGDGRLAHELTALLRAGHTADASALLQAWAGHPDLPDWMRAFVTALQAIAAGSRDTALAEAPDLSYGSAAEILLLIETLGA